MLTGLCALTIAALFTGAAVYINAVEQPARMGLDDSAALAEWKPAYRRGYAMQATLAVLGFLCGAAAWWSGGGPWFPAGAVLMLANWPWTLLGILPTNRVLMATGIPAADGATRTLLIRWNRLHAVRTGLGAAATLCFLCALS